MTNTYVTPGRVSPELVIIPMGLKDGVGNKIKRESIIFTPNAVNVGEFTTSNKEHIKFIENHEWFRTGRVLLIGSQNAIKPGVAIPSPKVGVVTTIVPEPIKPIVQKHRGRPAKTHK